MTRVSLTKFSGTASAAFIVVNISSMRTAGDLEFADDGQATEARFPYQLGAGWPWPA